MSRILVTGSSGFVGHHLVHELTRRSHDVSSLAYDGAAPEGIRELIKQHFICDLSDPSQVAGLPLDSLDAIINLAGLANVGASFDQPDLYKKVNVEVLTNLGKQLLAIGSKTRVLAISTGVVYDPEQPMPLTEQSRLTVAGSPYAQSKILMEQAAEDLRTKGLDCVVVRPFNHIGPGQLPGFLIPDLYQKVTSGKVVKVGNLNTRRDYTDVRDIVKAYADLVETASLKHSIYNVCHGQSYSGREILDIMLRATGVSDAQIEVDQSLIRANDPAELVGSCDRLQAETGWQPSIAIEQSIADFVAANRG
jgi:GDP-4-dehydro-6-deoxy-D-mannose reductase